MDLKPILVADEALAKAKAEILERETRLGVDCEGVNVGLSGEVTLIQIVTSDGDIYLFDVLVCPEIAQILKPILESSSILKIMHDCRGDRANLIKDFGIHIGPVFDTQIAYSFINPRATFRVGFNKLCQLLNAPTNPLKNTFHGIYRIRPEIWKERPLTRDMSIYAAADVRHLHNFYLRMSKAIRPNRQAEFERRCREAILKDEGDHSFRF